MEKKKPTEKQLMSMMETAQKALDAIEAYTERLQRETEELKAETELKRKELAELEASSKKHLDALGWTGITDEEMKWVQENYHKEFPFFRPTLQSIRERIAKKKGETYTPPPMDSKYQGFEEYQCLNGWLNPDGRYYPVPNFAQHDAWAWDYLDKSKGKLEAGRIISKAHGATEALQDAGWVRIMKWDGVDIKFVMNKDKLTASQKDSLFLFCALNQLELPFDKEY
jgi:hypothetical protein